MYEELEIPELQVIGTAEETILGSTAVGDDIAGEMLVPDFEFE